MPLERFLERCQEDTKRLINPSAAARLSRWRSCQTEKECVQFIKGLIRKQSGKENGWSIDQAGGVSLESIVLDHEPALFDEKDKKIAAQTLGRVSIWCRAK